MPFPLLYVKLGAVLLAIIALAGLYFWISSAFEERDKLRVTSSVQAMQVQQYQQMIAQNIKLNEDINNAISKIRLTSNNYIKAIDTGRPPVVSDGDVVQLVPGGMLQAMPSMPTFSNASTNSIKSVSEAD